MLPIENHTILSGMYQDMRITQVELSGLDNIENLLNFFMGKTLSNDNSIFLIT